MLPYKTNSVDNGVILYYKNRFLLLKEVHYDKGMKL